MRKIDLLQPRDFAFGKLAKSDTAIVRPSSQPTVGWSCNTNAVRTAAPVDTRDTVLGFQATDPDVHPRNWPERLKEWLSALMGCK
jgi:hypothetical protein